MILDPGYIRLWLPLLFIAAFALIPLYGIWYELRRWRRSNEPTRPEPVNVTYSYPKTHDERETK
jgi:hypothetical protein